MNIDISKIISGKEESSDVGFNYDLNNFRLLQDYDILEASPISFSGKIYKRNEHIIIDANFSGEATFRCSRCLKEFKQKILEDIKLDIPVVDKEGDEDTYLKGDYLDLSGIIEETLAFSLPMRALCSEECKGLCLICGKDLNINECNCDEDLIDPRLEKLKDFFSKNEEV